MSTGFDNEEDEVQLDPSDKAERRTLKLVLGVNAFQVLLAGSVGIIAESTGLLGAALDNLSDAAVYVVSLYAVGRSAVAKSRAASLSGVLLILSGLMLLSEIIRRFAIEPEPTGWAMIITAIVNGASNLVNMRLLQRHSEKGVHMKASIIFTGNDMLVNLGIVLSGIAITMFKSPVPDLLIGLVVTGVVIWGGITILSHARKARNPGNQ